MFNALNIGAARSNRHTEALDAAGLEQAEVTWSTPESDDPKWRITVATGHRVAVGALPPDRQSAEDLAAYLNALLRDGH